MRLRQLNPMRPLALTLWAAVSLFVLGGCGEEPTPEPYSFNAKPEIVAALREDLELVRHASDGGGSAALASGPQRIEAGASGSWTFTYTAGPLGIADGGWLFFQVAPFWSWSTPQATMPQAPGFTEVTTTAEGVLLEPETLDRQLLGVRVTGRALASGEVVTIVYGAASGPARSDSFAEDDSPFWFAVDGDGDGIRGLLPQPVTVDVVGREAARLILSLPSVARPGEKIVLSLAAVDALGNRSTTEESVVELLWRPLDPAQGSAPSTLPSQALLGREGHSRLSFTAPAAGAFRLEAIGPHGLAGFSNPMVVSPSVDKVIWGDLHGHSNFSDGTGTPQQYFQYARDVAGLDFVALTDHDHWGIKALSQNPDMWAEIRHQVGAFNDSGSFVTVLGYEWTNWLHGHRHVLYFDDDGPVLSATDPRYETPAQLWTALASLPALTFAHHSAGEPIATNWSYPPDPDLEPVTEIVSIHGSSEASDGPVPVRGARDGHFVRDILGLGYRLGFIGSGDSHDGHPGLSLLANPSAGLAALVTEDLSRDGIHRALKARRTYATNGPRMVLSATLDDATMGSVVTPTDSPRLRVEITGTSELESLEIIRVSGASERIDLGGQLQALIERDLAPAGDGEVLYLRVLQRDGGAAWSSPFFFERGNRNGGQNRSSKQ